jgi:hypothetical protein
MTVILPKIIAPDTSHWANWIDAALGQDPERRRTAQDFHQRLLTAGRIPFLSWHHLEELLVIDDVDWARRRIAFIQSVPLVAFMRMPGEEFGVGSVIEVVAAEVAASLDGHDTPRNIRAAARMTLIQTGSGVDAIGEEAWVWDALRGEFLARHEKAKLVTATRAMNLFDDNRTVGEIARGTIRAPSKRAERVRQMYDQVDSNIRSRGDAQIADSRAMTMDFMDRVKNFELPDNNDVRSLIELALVGQGVEPHEITDDRLLSELNELALYRAKLKVIAEKLGRPYDEIKHVDMQLLPSWQIEKALSRFGQDRQRRNGSDLNDGHLATLAAYVDELFVDKRTAEDFRRVVNRKDDVASLICVVRKAAKFEELAVSA